MAAPKKKNRLLAAAVFALVGLVLLATGGSILGALFGGVAVAAFGWAMMRPAGRSLVGQKCAACGDGIFIEAQAELCAVCAKTLHARCAAPHAAQHVGRA